MSHGNEHEGEYYWCLAHRCVEPYQGCRAGVRLGPYSTYADAEQGLATVERRNVAWDNDPRFNDEADEKADDEAGDNANNPANNDAGERVGDPIHVQEGSTVGQPHDPNSTKGWGPFAN